MVRFSKKTKFHRNGLQSESCNVFPHFGTSVYKFIDQENDIDHSKQFNKEISNELVDTISIFVLSPLKAILQIDLFRRIAVQQVDTASEFKSISKCTPRHSK